MRVAAAIFFRQSDALGGAANWRTRREKGGARTGMERSFFLSISRSLSSIHSFVRPFVHSFGRAVRFVSLRGETRPLAGRAPSAGDSPELRRGEASAHARESLGRLVCRLFIWWAARQRPRRGPALLFVPFINIAAGRLETTVTEVVAVMLLHGGALFAFFE